MRLSKLTIYGFKSFADKVEIQFGSGMTAVVGPNGCGKTNIVDAIKWVMGEQKPTAIRGKSMEDVIFNGSASRKPLGFAEVSLAIEDTQNVLPVDVPEITITRRLFRSGESEYLMNRQACRLRDIYDLFMDSGIANNSYSVIQTEMVDLMVSDKAEERRTLFEEAAGIQKYKSRRRETQNKLRSTEQDLLRLSDLVGEVEKTVRSLKRQVNRAKRYQRYRERLSSAEVHLALLRDRQFEEEMKPLREELRALKESRQGVGTDMAGNEAAVAEAKAREVELEQALAALQKDVDTTRDAVREVEGELIALRERRTAAGSAAERGRSEAGEMDRRRAAALAEHERLTGELVEARAQRERLEAEEGVLAERMAEIDVRLGATREKFEDLKERHSRASNYYQDEAQRAEFLQFKVTERAKRLETLRRQEQEAREGARSTEEEIERLAAELKAALAQRDALREERRQAESARDTAAEAVQEQMQTLSDAEGALRAAVAERDVVKDLIDRLEGVDDAARELRQEPEAGFGRLLAEGLDVEAEAVPAVESALGPALEGLLVADPDTLRRAVARLEDRAGGGRAVLIAPHLAAPAAGGLPDWAPAGDPVRGDLGSRIGGEGDEARVARALLARILWVKELDDAVALAKEAGRAGWTLVTDAGELILPGGVVHAGCPARGQADGLLARRQRLDDLQARVTAAEGAAEGVRAERDRLRRDVETAKGAAQAVTGRLESADRTVAETERSHGSARSRHEGMVERAEELKARIADEEDELKEDQVELEKLSPLLSSALEESGQLGGAMEDQRRRVEAVLSEREETRGEHQELRVSRVRAEHRIEALEREMALLTESAGEMAEAAERHRGEVQEAEKTIETLAGTIHDLDEVLGERRRARIAAEERLATLEKDYLEHRNVQNDLEEELRKERRGREEQQERIHAVEMRLSELSMRRENLAERIDEEYAVKLEAVDEAALMKEGAEPPAYEELEEEVRTLRQRLDQIGPVNLLALEEYESESERLEFLTVQKADLEEAKATLEQTIRKINKTARQRFLETFEAIRTNFRRTYAAFFEGGEADVYLAEDGDPLESRIEIVARPKGKILKSITALSGGEKALTAVALLFAIYLVKPSPFCILDEVDAPLDEANIGRFLQVLKSFEETTQFILITHNKRTMEASDAFLGITMQEAGVSKVVGVRFEEEAAA